MSQIKEVTLFGRPVEGPLLRSIALALTLVFALLALLFFWILIPMHFVLRSRGLNGFYFDRQVIIGKRSFAKHQPPRYSGKFLRDR